MTPAASRIADAIAIRDAALRLLRAGGQYTEHSARCLMWDSAEPKLRIALRSPFQRLAPASPNDATAFGMAAGYVLALENQVRAQSGKPPIAIKDSLPWGLDIWAEGSKRLNLEWEDGARVHLITFSRGNWEAALVELAAKY